MEELGEPYRRLWGLLSDTHGERDAARVLAKVLGAINDHGQQAVAEALHKALNEGRVDLLALRSQSEHFHLPDVRVEVPKSLEKYQVQSAKAADYDVLLGVR